MDKIRDYLRISQAAEYLGVSPGPLRNWDEQGKICAHRVPQNGYRLFRLADLEAILREVNGPAQRPRRASKVPQAKRRA